MALACHVDWSSHASIGSIEKDDEKCTTHYLLPKPKQMDVITSTPRALSPYAFMV